MPTGAEIQQYITAAWRLMLGQRDAVRLLDLSADGFWNSFYAIVVASPLMFAGWVATANGFGESAADFGGRFSILLRLMTIDLAAWIGPLVLLAFAARPIGIADRFVPYVVASNWGSVVSSVLMLPISLFDLFVAGDSEVADGLSLIIFLAVLVLNWRLTNSAIDRGAGLATAVFALVLIASLVILIGLQDMFGLMPAQG